MKIIVASDSFKGSLSSCHIGSLVKKAARQVSPRMQVQALEIADGGEGTVDAFFKASGKSMRHAEVLGPDQKPVDAAYAILKDGTAVLEVASVVGLAQHKHRYNILEASSFGVGQLMEHAMNQGCKKLIIGLGGSCTSDGGIGLAAALGFSFLDLQKKSIECTPRNLCRLAAIETNHVTPGFWNTQIVFACDVTNPLYGHSGAAYIFGPQKGANSQEVRLIDEGLCRLNEVVLRTTGVNLQKIPGTGAAGGMCSIPLAYGTARLRPGLELLLSKLNFDHLIQDADLIITGEGRLDSQSLHGKVPLCIARHAKAARKPLIAMVGSVQEGLPNLQERGITEVVVISPQRSKPEENMKHAAENYYHSAIKVLQAYA